MARKSKREPSKPQISVVMCTYNRPQLLERAVNSILAQTFQDWELLIVNDGGQISISLPEKVMSDPHIRLINLEHQGQPRALNTGVQAASADLITFLDDDDVIYTHNLGTMVEAMQRSEAEMLYFPIIVPDRPVMGTFPWTEERLLAGDCAPNLGTVIRRAAFDKIGLYDERCPVFWDWDWQLRAFNEGLKVERGGGTPSGEYYVYPNSVVRKRGTPIFHDSIRERAQGKRTNELTLVVPSYNYPQFFHRLVEAMYNQTCPNWQLIIVDDASAKDFQKEIKEWERYNNITVKLHKENRGTCATIAEGLAMVKTAYCAVIDADNFLLPDYVRKMIDFLDANPDKVGVHCAFAEHINMEPTGKVIGKAPITYDLALEQPPGTMLATWRTEVAQKILPEFELCPDWDMMLRGTEIGPVGYINEPLLGWENHQTSRWWWNVDESMACGVRCKETAIARRQNVSGPR